MRMKTVASWALIAPLSLAIGTAFAAGREPAPKE